MPLRMRAGMTVTRPSLEDTYLELIGAGAPLALAGSRR